MEKDKTKIPKGDYCYKIVGTHPWNGIKIPKLEYCPYWDSWPDMPQQESGYCHFLERGDWQEGFSLLWDQVKECGENDFTDEEYDEMDREADLRYGRGKNQMTRVGIDLGFTQDEKDLLLYLARGTVKYILTKEELVYGNIPDKLKERNLVFGTFVSIHKGQDLRGCIGSFESTKPLYILVMETAKKSAFQDSRFAPIDKTEYPELSFEISALTPPEKIKGPEDIEIGKHGLIIRAGLSVGLLLPQVATEYHWDPQAFIYHVCLKANLHPQVLEQERCQLFRFSADVWGEI